MSGASSDTGKATQAMNDGLFHFKIGDKITLPTYQPDEWIEVAWVGNEFFGATNGNVYGDFAFWRLWVAPVIERKQ